MRTLEQTFEILYDHLKKEKKILQARITPKTLQDLYEEGKAYIRLRGVSPIAFAALWPTNEKEWLEFGTLWVHPSARGHGLSSLAFDRCISLAPDDTQIILVTTSTIVARMAKKRGWNEWKHSEWTKDPLWCDLVDNWGSQSPKVPRKFPEGGKLFIHPRVTKEFKKTMTELGL